MPLSITFEEHVYDGEGVSSSIMRDVFDRVKREWADTEFEPETPAPSA